MAFETIHYSELVPIISVKNKSREDETLFRSPNTAKLRRNKERVGYGRRIGNTEVEDLSLVDGSVERLHKLWNRASKVPPVDIELGCVRMSFK